jgi:2-polyprenyl-3-methyl-5-hydroxy-6-metoxy-1,4-benzoquinol methylase
MHCLGKRLILPELLDTLPPDQARASLLDLVRINRHWGGHSTLRHLLQETVPDGQPFSVLDVGAASGDMGACIRRWYPAAKVTSLDYVESHLVQSAAPKVAGDAFRLPFRPGSFDYVFCSLFLHHFQDMDVVRLLRGFGEVARKAVLVIDLERNPIPYYFIAWSRPILGWDPVTVHDGAISVEAAFHRKELEDLARQAGLRNPRARVFRPAFRIALAAGALERA